MSGDEQDTGWSVSELCSSMQGLQCEDSAFRSSVPSPQSVPSGVNVSHQFICFLGFLSLRGQKYWNSTRNKLDPQETPRPDAGAEQPRQGATLRRTHTNREQEEKLQCGSRHRILTGGSEDDEGAEDDKENTRVRKRLRVRLFGSSSPDDQLIAVRGSKRQSNSSPAEGEAESPDSESLMLFQRLRSRRTPAHTLVPDSTIADHCLIGDFSKHHVLPVEQVTHQDLHCVSAQTVASLIRGQFSAVVEDFLVVDCRYPYEYRGGHIRGAVNLYTETQILQAFLQGSSTPQTSPVPRRAPGGASSLGARGGGGATPESGLSEGASSPRKLVVFHCEFSSERGPRLCQYLRELDRALNAQTYPYLLYPELYLLQGGYKHFYFCCPELCEPCGYVPMHHKDFKDQLHCFSRKRRQSRRRRLVRTQQRMSRS